MGACSEYQAATASWVQESTQGPRVVLWRSVDLLVVDAQGDVAYTTEMQWSLLILSLPTENATARMRAWRALKASGAAVLRDGVYLLPASEERRKTLEGIETDITAAGGMAWLLGFSDDRYAFASAFDRTREYAQLADEIKALDKTDVPKDAGGWIRRVRKLRKTWAALTEIDFFPGETQRQTDALLRELEAHLSPGEPGSHPGTVRVRNPAVYTRRLWATRRSLWIDRIASAWLIRRFIDPEARFLWLASPPDCPTEAVGFDFDGAEFTHVETMNGLLVTFETLTTAFGLDRDVALARIGAIVHQLDVGGLPVAEAAGLERLLQGIRERTPDDDSLLAEAGRLLDDLHLAFQRDTQTP
jgi:hypothetical protein